MSVSIADILGNTVSAYGVSEVAAGQWDIATQSLSPGMYTVYLSTTTGAKTYKVLKR